MNTATLQVPVLPDSAPFTPAQRAWLNGFFAGLFGAGGNSPTTESAPAIAEEEQMPWHDPAMDMQERLKLAEGKPKARQLMAAMAQLDCGACGYQCQTYAEAIARGEEKDLTRCAPGGKETSRKLKELFGSGPAANQVVSPSQVRIKRPAQSESKPAHDRSNPFSARLLKCQPLNKAGSAKDTRLVEFDLKGSGLTYTVGDALGVYPENCPDTVNWILERLSASGAEEVTAPDGAKTNLLEALLRHSQITTPTEKLVELLADTCAGHVHADALRAMLGDIGPGIPPGHEIIDLLTMFPSARPSMKDFIGALRPLQPRLYSISSSLRAHPDEVHLTVGVVRYVNARQRQCKGVASTFLAERLRPGQKARIFVHTSNNFRLPADGSVPIIMVGPGTGIAPFRAFLQERKAAQTAGRNWLICGDQRREFDFLYGDELEGYSSEGWLSNLDATFSRDQSEKIYVQHRMIQRGEDIWNWLSRGAHFYVCGDAKRMAADVDDALRQIVSQHGGMSDENAEAFLADLTKSRRYQRDVY